MKRILFTFLLLAMLVGCQRQPVAAPVPTVQPTVDPVASFEEFVASRPIRFSASSLDSPYCEKLELTGTSYDVKTTDSLVSPFIGIIIYAYHNHNGNYSHDETFTFTYAYQDAAWVLTSIESSELGMLPSIIGGKKFGGMCEVSN